MTTTGFRPAAVDETAPTGLSRVAAAASLLLGLALAVVLPAIVQAVSYVGVLAAVSAAVALVTGYVLWTRATMVVRALAALGAGATLAGQVLQFLRALPGAHELGPVTRWESGPACLLASAVVVSLLLDARRRRVEPPQEHPYAL